MGRTQRVVVEGRTQRVVVEGWTQRVVVDGEDAESCGRWGGHRVLW